MSGKVEVTARSISRSQPLATLSLMRGNPAATAWLTLPSSISIESWMPKSAPATTSRVAPPSSRCSGVPVMRLCSVHQPTSSAALANELPLNGLSRSLISAAVSYSRPTTCGPNTSVTW